MANKLSGVKSDRRTVLRLFITHSGGRKLRDERRRVYRGSRSASVSVRKCCCLAAHLLVSSVKHLTCETLGVV